MKYHTKPVSATFETPYLEDKIAVEDRVSDSFR